MARKGEASAKCADCGKEIRWSVYDESWYHTRQPKDGHAARHPVGP